MKSKWLTARETAAYLRVSERQLLRWRQAEIFEAGIHYRRKFPSANSAIIKGIDQRNKKINHGIKNEPPPFAPTILGNRQIFPVPIAAPIVANINPNLPLNSSLDDSD